MDTINENHSTLRRSFIASREKTLAATWALSLGFAFPAWAQLENSPSGSVFIEGYLCVSDSFSCGAAEPILANEDVKIKDGIPALYFENTTANAGDSKEWYFRTDFDRFRLYDHGNAGNANVEVLGIQSGAPANSMQINSNGRVGLGTAAPARSLHILQNGLPAIRIQNEVQTWDIEADQFTFALSNVTASTRPFQVASAAPTDSFFVDTDGSVGFGTDAPLQELEIFESEFPAIRLRSGSRIWDIEGDHVSFSLHDVTGTERPFEIATGAPGAALYINAAGNIGSGTVVPAQAVDIARYADAARFQLTSFTNDATQAPQYIQRRARGTSVGNAAALQTNDNLGLFSFRGHDGTAMTGSRAAITVQAAGNWTGVSNPTRILFGTTAVGSTTVQSVLEITPDAKVKINGSTLNVPDFVFEDDYPLMPLDELRAFIDENGHLPGIPSADEVNAEGLDLAGSQMGHLQKIEELTLYTLQQEQRLAAQDAELGALRQRLAAVDALGAQTAMLQSEVLAMRAELENLRRQGDAR